MRWTTFCTSVILLAMLLILPACDISPCDPCNDNIYGSWSYRGYDADGIQIVEGAISFVAEDNDSLSGHWSLSVIGTPDCLGPQIGTGELVGWYADEVWIIELNPNFADNNVGLTGTVSDGRFSGDWGYVGFPGLICAGTFEAEKRLAISPD